jgi:hypothetical protein
MWNIEVHQKVPDTDRQHRSSKKIVGHILQFNDSSEISPNGDRFH